MTLYLGPLCIKSEDTIGSEEHMSIPYYEDTLKTTCEKGTWV